jgi:protease-4
MKKYFPNLLPSRELRLAILVAIVAALGIAACSYGKWTLGPALIAAAISMVAAFWYLVVRPARVPGDAVVMIRLAGPLNEDAHLSPLQSLIRPSALTLYHLRYALEAAASDPGVRAVVVEIAGLEAGMATALELNRLLGAIRAAGKRVVAILTGDTTGVRDYLVAAGAGEIVANPDTMFTMLGVAAGNVFLKSALDKLNIQVQTLQWKEYKGAAEMVNRDAMSPEMRESLGAIVADWQTIVVDAIAAGRKLERARAE